MRNVNRIVGKDGKVRLYFRKEGHASQPLRSAWGSPELEAEVQAILKALAPADAVPGTLKAAALAYEKGPDFAALAESTRYEYGLLLKELASDFGPTLVHRFTAEQVLRLRAVWAARGHRAAELRLVVLQHVLTPAIIGQRIPGPHPFASLPPLRRPADASSEAHVIWPAAVVEAVIRAALARGNPGLARAVAIARYTGARRGDLVRLARSARGAGRLRFVSGKRRVQVDLVEDPELTSWLAATPDHPPARARAGRRVARGVAPVRTLTLVYNLAGAPYTADGLGQELQQLVDQLREDGRIPDEPFTLHGLRHTRGVELALAGATDAQVSAQLGHASASSAAQYRRQADRIRLADDASEKVAALREQRSNQALQNDPQKSCKTGETTP